MARLSRIDSPSSYSSGYEKTIRTRAVSLPEALQLVAKGDMESYLLYGQSSKEIRELLDEVSKQRSGNDFINLRGTALSNVCLEVATLQGYPAEEIVQRLFEGKLSGNVLYRLVSHDFQNALDLASRQRCSKDFCGLDPQRQVDVCRQVLSPEAISLKDALQLVVDQKLDGGVLFSQASKEVCDMLDEVSQGVFQHPFAELKQGQQIELCKLLLAHSA